MAMDCMTKFYFFMAIFTAVICNVVIKAMMEIKSVGTSGELEPFTPASYLTLLMAFGMFFALPWHIWQERPLVQSQFGACPRADFQPPPLCLRRRSAVLMRYRAARW